MLDGFELPKCHHDLIHLAIVGRRHVLSLPLCEVMRGVHSRQDGRHCFTFNGKTECLEGLALTKFFKEELSDFGKVDAWYIQTAEQPEDEQNARAFFERYHHQ